jgi:hypothetical protein
MSQWQRNLLTSVSRREADKVLKELIWREVGYFRPSCLPVAPRRTCCDGFTWNVNGVSVLREKCTNFCIMYVVVVDKLIVIGLISSLYLWVSFLTLVCLLRIHHDSSPLTWCLDFILFVSHVTCVKTRAIDRGNILPWFGLGNDDTTRYRKRRPSLGVDAWRRKCSTASSSLSSRGELLSVKDSAMQ